MMTFGVDSHVEESLDTWKYLEEKFAGRRPIPLTVEDRLRSWNKTLSR